MKREIKKKTQRRYNIFQNLKNIFQRKGLKLLQERSTWTSVGCCSGGAVWVPLEICY